MLDQAGLFGYVIDGTVKNIRVENADITAGNIVGGVTGGIENGSVSNCYVTGEINGGEEVGGVAGYLNNSSVSNCSVTGDVIGSFNLIGGVAEMLTSAAA